MPLQSSGPISLGNINTELLLTSTNQIGMNDSQVRNLLGKATAGSLISLNDAFSKDNAPSQPTIVSVLFNSFSFSWSAVPNAVSYRVDVATTSNFTSGFVLNNSSTASISASVSASSSTTYYIRVKAVGSTGLETGYSTTRTVTTSAAPPPPPPPPSPPPRLSAS